MARAAVDTASSQRSDIQASRKRLVDSTIVLLSSKWYGTVSVAEICRHAGFSNGLFYRYFPDKEAIFRHILEIVIDGIARALADIPGDTPSQRLKQFVHTIVGFSRDNPELVRVFREGQYRFFEYERRLRAVYEEALGRAIGRRPTLAEYVFGLGGLRFSATRAAFNEVPIRLDALESILENGLFQDLEFDQEKVFSRSISPLPLQIMPDARERILREGKQLFGRQGYFETNVHEITMAAGLSTGTFYTYFETKEAFYQVLIERVGREVRRFISMNLDPALNPLERELRGLWLFMVFLSIDRYCYGIVREAEFVLPASVKAYYDSFAKGYRTRGGEQSAGDRTTEIEFMLGVAHYLGIEVIFDESPENARNIIKEIGKLYRQGFGGTIR
jgi:AcrR family transcriptional regulator